jgi:hypothetical protein
MSKALQFAEGKLLYRNGKLVLCGCTCSDFPACLGDTLDLTVSGLSDFSFNDFACGEGGDCSPACMRFDSDLTWSNLNGSYSLERVGTGADFLLQLLDPPTECPTAPMDYTVVCDPEGKLKLSHILQTRCDITEPTIVCEFYMIVRAISAWLGCQPDAINGEDDGMYIGGLGLDVCWIRRHFDLVTQEWSEWRCGEAGWPVNWTNCELPSVYYHVPQYCDYAIDKYANVCTPEQMISVLKWDRGDIWTDPIFGCDYLIYTCDDPGELRATVEIGN